MEHDDQPVDGMWVFPDEAMWSIGFHPSSGLVPLRIQLVKTNKNRTESQNCHQILEHLAVCQNLVPL